MSEVPNGFHSISPSFIMDITLLSPNSKKITKVVQHKEVSFPTIEIYPQITQNHPNENRITAFAKSPT